jgi:hypothetical protein
MGFFSFNKNREYSPGQVITWKVAETPAGIHTDQGVVAKVHSNSCIVKTPDGVHHTVMHEWIMS